MSYIPTTNQVPNVVTERLYKINLIVLQVSWQWKIYSDQLVGECRKAGNQGLDS